MPWPRPISRRRSCAIAITARRNRSGWRTLSDAEWISHFGRFQPLPDNQPIPLALRYHGHQFRHYNPDLGDGRGFLFAQLLDDRDRLLDLGTKGSGKTPWSRGGDGRLTLKGGVREVLATAMLEALGVPTSKSLFADRDRRATGARRRALPDPIVGAGAPEPQPYPLRHLRAPGLSQRGRDHARSGRLYPGQLLPGLRGRAPRCSTPW